MPKLSLLAIGAHPDDIEIGSAALISKAVSLGIETHFLVLTDDADDGAIRRSEAARAASALGVPPGHILFAGLPDGRLRADRKSVTEVRKIVSAAKLRPQLIVTHTNSDSHNDHIEANRISHAAFRACTFLHYSIYLSSESDRFAPRVFIEVSGDKVAQKNKALANHDSQRARLERQDLSKYESHLGELAGMERAEAFEVSSQESMRNVYDEILALSESPFHRFWNQIIRDKDIALFYEASTIAGASIDWPSTHADIGRDQLRQAFNDQWLPRSPLREGASNGESVQQKLERRSVILAGGPVGNLIVRELYNRFRSTLWTIDYEMPRREPAYLYNRASGDRYYPEYDSRHNIAKDYGVIARIQNPYASAEHVVYAAGATGLGTRVGLQFLSDLGAERDIAKNFDIRGNVQIAFSVKPDTLKINVMEVYRG